MVDGLLAAPFDGSIEAEQDVAGFSARWTRRLVDAIEVVAQPTVRSGHVVLGRAEWHEVQVLKFIHHQFVLEPARSRAAPAWSGPAAGHAGRVAARAGSSTPTRRPGCRGGCTTSSSWPRPSSRRTPPTARPRPAGRAIIDFVASLTDSQAVALLDALSGRSGQLWTDAFVL